MKYIVLDSEKNTRVPAFIVEWNDTIESLLNSLYDLSLPYRQAIDHMHEMERKYTENSVQYREALNNYDMIKKTRIDYHGKTFSPDWFFNIYKFSIMPLNDYIAELSCVYE